MKKLALIAALIIGVSAVAAAQPRAIGGNIGSSIDVSYQHYIGSNVLDCTLSAPLFMGIGTTVTYDWVDPFNATIPWNYKGEWHWQLGAGASAGMYWNPVLTQGPSHDPFNPDFAIDMKMFGYAGAAGHVGVAYDFWFPLEISVDWRPTFGPSFGEGGVHFYTMGCIGTTIGVRYLF